MKSFCVAGPIIPEIHYFVRKRLDWALLDSLLAEMKYFLLHAPRQSGKTTAVIEYVKELNSKDRYTALYLTTEPAHTAKNDNEKALYWILSQFNRQLSIHLPEQQDAQKFLQTLLNHRPVPEDALMTFLQYWAEINPKPLALFFDEADGLVENTLTSLLKQLRTGYTNRPKHFPQSICLVGVRELKDYKFQSQEDKEKGALQSPFNIVAKSILLKNFSEAEVKDLYLQHTQETGQVFTEDAIKHAYHLTQGQPWLVNALALEACLTERSLPLTKEIIEKAKNALVYQRATHLDALIDKLNENRVRKIIDSIILGESPTITYSDDDIQYAMDLGLISSTADTLQIANPIYKEVIPAALAYKFQKSISEKSQWYENQDGSLNMVKLLESFTHFFRENSESWLADFNYKESGPHILMMAFLQRIINGGGLIHREYALGKKRVDLLIHWKKYSYVIELKIKYGENTLAEGLEQTARYMDVSGATEAHLVLFDRDSKKSWEEKISHEWLSHHSKKLMVWTL